MVLGRAAVSFCTRLLLGWWDGKICVLLIWAIHCHQFMARTFVFNRLFYVFCLLCIYIVVE